MAMNIVKCNQCDFENDRTRVFCQNCGTRLEREPEMEATIVGPSRVSSERPSYTDKGKQASYGRGFWRALRLLVLFGIVAILILAFLMALQPDGFPAEVTADKIQAKRLYEDLSFSKSTSAPSIDLDQTQVNNYLSCHLASEPSEESLYKPKFIRSFVVIENGKLRFVVEHTIYNRPIFIFSDFVPEANSNTIKLTLTGGGIGRVPFDHRLLPFLSRLIEPFVKDALDFGKIVTQASGIELKSGKATLKWHNSHNPDE